MTTREHAAPTRPIDGTRHGSVGFIGLGAMGRPMTSHLSRAGMPVIGYDIDPRAVRHFSDDGGTAAGDIADVVRQASIVITSLPGFSAVDEVVGALADTHRSQSFDDTVVIESSTLALEQKQAVRHVAEAAGIHVFDCPVSGTSAQAINGDLVGYLSGPVDGPVDSVRAVMNAICRATYWTGEFGNGTKMKLVANLLVAVHTAAAAEALLLARRAGLDLDLVLESVGDGAGSSRMLQVRGPLMARGDVEHATARVDLIQKDIAAIRLLADSLASPTPLLDAGSRIYDLAADAGRAGHDAAAVYCVLEDLARES